MRTSSKGMRKLEVRIGRDDRMAAVGAFGLDDYYVSRFRAVFDLVGISAMVFLRTHARDARVAGSVSLYIGLVNRQSSPTRVS